MSVTRAPGLGCRANSRNGSNGRDCNASRNQLVAAKAAEEQGAGAWGEGRGRWDAWPPPLKVVQDAIMTPW